MQTSDPMEEVRSFLQGHGLSFSSPEKAISYLLSLLADDASRDTLRALGRAGKERDKEDRRRAYLQAALAGGLQREELVYSFTLEVPGWESVPVHSRKNPYFRPEFFPQCGEDSSSPVVLVDGGGFIGDTLLEAGELFGERLSMVYVFEPDAANHALLTEMIRENRCEKKVRVYPEALSLLDGSAGLLSDGSHSRLSGDGKHVVRTVNAGRLFSSLFPSPTLIKLDIEGNEAPVLLSMEEYLAEHTPDLAVCAYHRAEDIVLLPLLLHALQPSYSLYLRHLSDTFLDTVLYAHNAACCAAHRA